MFLFPCVGVCMALYQSATDVPPEYKIWFVVFFISYYTLSKNLCISYYTIIECCCFFLKSVSVCLALC